MEAQLLHCPDLFFSEARRAQALGKTILTSKEHPDLEYLKREPLEELRAELVKEDGS